MTCDEHGFGMFLRRFVQAVHELIVVVHSGLEDDSPGPGIHEPIVGVVHRPIAPDRI